MSRAILKSPAHSVFALSTGLAGCVLVAALWTGNSVTSAAIVSGKFIGLGLAMARSGPLD
ncbi:MAG: hypothetical protein AAF636_16245 [Pseudomonadota bacterium]